MDSLEVVPDAVELQLKGHGYMWLSFAVEYEYLLVSYGVGMINDLVDYKLFVANGQEVLPADGLSHAE